jgi:hypothetical protein
MASFARFCRGTSSGRAVILAGLALFAHFHETLQPVRPPFWQGWLRLRRSPWRGEVHFKPIQPAHFIQIASGFVSEIL